MLRGLRAVPGPGHAVPCRAAGALRELPGALSSSAPAGRAVGPRADPAGLGAPGLRAWGPVWRCLPGALPREASAASSSEPSGAGQGRAARPGPSSPGRSRLRRPSAAPCIQQRIGSCVPWIPKPGRGFTPGDARQSPLCLFGLFSPCQ